MGHEYTPTEEDRPAADASQAEDIIELRLMSTGKNIGPIDIVDASGHSAP